MSFLLVLVLTAPGTFQVVAPVLKVPLADCVAAARMMNSDSDDPRIAVCAPDKGDVAFAM